MYVIKRAFIVISEISQSVTTHRLLLNSIGKQANYRMVYAVPTLRNRVLIFFPRDAIIVSVMDSFTSIFAGFVIFAIIGYMSHELQVEIGDVAAEGEFAPAVNSACMSVLAANCNFIK